MHEFSIVQALLDQVAAEAQIHHARSVRRLEVRLGDCCGVDGELLQTAWLAFRERTLCSEAELRIERVPTEWVCRVCHEPIALGQPLRCGGCGEPARLRAGDEIILQRIEMEVPIV